MPGNVGCLWCAEWYKALSPLSPTRKEMGFAEGWDLERFCLRQCTLPTPSGFVFWGPCTSTKGLWEDFSASTGRTLQSHSLWNTPFPNPIIARKHSPLCWVPCPHSHSHYPVSTSQPTPERLPYFERRDGFGARAHGFEAQLWTHLEKPLDLFQS